MMENRKQISSAFSPPSDRRASDETREGEKRGRRRNQSRWSNPLRKVTKKKKPKRTWQLRYKPYSALHCMIYLPF